MVAIGIAAELIYVTSGRFSAAGNATLQLIPLGILLYGLLEHFYPQFCRAYRGLAPILLLIYSIGMLAFQGTSFLIVLSVGFGIIIGLFVCAVLVSFLESGDARNRGLKIGISASLYSLAIYPFKLGYQFLSALLPKTPITTIGFLILVVLLSAAFYFWPKSNEDVGSPDPLESRVLASRSLGLLLVGLTILVLLGQVMNSGTLEKQGGTASIPFLYLVIIILRIPFGALLGYLIDKRFSILNMAIPIVLLVLGCLLPLFLYGDSPGNNMAYLLLNLGVKGCVFLIHILCMIAAARRSHKGFIAGLGLLVYFSSEGFLNLHVLGLSVADFARRAEFLLPLTIILFAVLVFVLLIFLDALPQKNQPEVTEHKQTVLTKTSFTGRELEVVQLLANSKGTEEIAAVMGVKTTTVQNHVNSLLSKTGSRNRIMLVNKFRNGEL